MDPLGSTLSSTAESALTPVNPRVAPAQAPEERGGEVARGDGRRTASVSERERAGRSDETRARSAEAREAPEVSISDEARALFEASRADSESRSDSELAEEESSFARFREATATEELDPVESTRLIAVRVGPAPLEDLSSGAPSGPEAALTERALLRGVSRVLAQPEASDDDPVAQRDGAVARGEPSPLPGLETRDAVAAGREEVRSERSFEIPGRENEAASATDPRAEARNALGTLEGAGEVREREAVDAAARPELSTSDLRRASSVAGQTGAVTRDASRDASAVSREGVAPEDQTADRAESEVSQTGSVEAATSEALVSRFLGNLEPEDPGPVPRTREVLGSRSTP